MRVRAVSLLCLLAAAAGVTAGPPEVAPAAAAPEPPAAAFDKAIVAEIRERNEVMPNLRHLSDEIGPRLTGSPRLEAANKWAADRMKSYGLENVRLEPWEIPVGWERGTARLRVVDPDNGRALLAASAGWTSGTNGPLTGPVVVLQARTKADLAKYKGKLKNALILRGPPADVRPIGEIVPTPKEPKDGPKAGEQRAGEPKAGETKEPATRGDPKDATAATDPKTPAPQPRPVGAPEPGVRPGSFADLRAFRQELNEFLRAEGAAVVLVDSAKPHGLLVTTGGWREADRGAAAEPLPSLFVAHEHYQLLYRLATRKDAPPARCEVEVTNKFVPGPVTVFNTVGEVRGSDKPDEFVVVGAHLDSWDLASGTTDNGTGSCVVLEAARTVAALAAKGQRPKRTIRFVLFTGEEQGLHGSKQYVKRHADEMPRTSAAFVHDTGTGRVLGFGLQGRAAVRPVLEPELTTLATFDGWKGLDLGSLNGTDHQSFEAAGVPGFACRQDADEYRLTHHTQTDTFDKAKAPNLVQGAQVMSIAATRVANLPALLPRDKPAPKGGRRE